MNTFAGFRLIFVVWAFVDDTFVVSWMENGITDLFFKNISTSFVAIAHYRSISNKH